MGATALALWGAALALGPSPGFPDLEQARALAAEGSEREALELVEAVLAASAGDTEAELLEGVLLARLGRGEEARNVFLELIQEHPELPEPYNNLAALYGASGEYEQAAEILKLALRTHPSYEVVYENLTRVYGRLAGQAYDRALGVEVESPPEPVALDLLDEVGSRLETTPSRIAADRAAERDGEAGAPSAPDDAEPALGRVFETVRAWAAAWSAQRADEYLAFYSDRFSPPDGLSREAWAERRRERVLSPSSVEVSLSAETYEQVSAKKVRVRFRQSYTSDDFTDVVDKRLDLIWEDGDWKILRERIDRGAG